VTIGAGTEPPSFVDRVLADPRGNGLAILVLAGMVAVVVRSWAAPRRPSRATRANRLDWLTPLLAVAGLGVASYLAHVEVREIEAVCGPVGDCNTVQQSDYARLFGLVPIGVLGVLGFASILVAWGVGRAALGCGPALPMGRGRARGADRTRHPLLDLSHLPRAFRHRRHLPVVPQLGGDHDDALQAGAFARPERGPAEARGSDDPGERCRRYLISFRCRTLPSVSTNSTLSGRDDRG
jgi:uncharacterized membrane protein